MPNTNDALQLINYQNGKALINRSEALSVKSKKDAGITMQSKHEAASSEVLYYDELHAGSKGRIRLRQGYTSKAPVTVSTLHDQKNLMLFQLSQFSVCRPKSRLRKSSSSTSSRYRFNSEEIISPNN